VRVPDVRGLSLEDAVRAYCAEGWYLLPIRSGKHAGSAVGSGWPEKSSRDAETVLRLLRETRAEGIALHVGRSGLVAFDVDTPEALPEGLRADLSKAPHQGTRPSSPGRGHYLFDAGGVTYSNSLGSLPKGWGDIRGKNGIIVLAPTPHSKEGGEYRWVRVGDIPPLPAHLARALTPATDKADAASVPEVREFFAAYTSGDSEGIDKYVRRFREAVAAGQSRHEAMVPILAEAMKAARGGQFSAEEAAQRLFDEFAKALAGERDAGREFEGMLAWAVGQANREEVSVLEALSKAGEDPMPEPSSNEHMLELGAARTHVGSALRLAERFKGRFAWSPQTKWYAWDEKRGRWVEDAEHLVRKAIATELPETIWEEIKQLTSLNVDPKEVGKFRKYWVDSQSVSHQRAVLDLLQTMLLVDWREFDSDLNKLTVGNGTLHFDRGEVTLRPHNPADMITRGTDVNYNPNARAPFWEATLERFLPDPEVRAFLQRFAGSILVGGGVREQIIPIMFGTGANGKSTFVTGIRAALGDELALEVDPGTLRPDHRSGSNPSPDKLRLRGARYVYAVEATGELDAQFLKRLSGGEEIVARGLHQKTISFKPQFTLTIIANEEPEFNDASEGLWRRIKRIPFEVRIPDEERIEITEVERLMREQAEGILAWCVEGYKQYARMGLTPPACVEISSARMRNDADPVRRFVTEFFRKVEGSVVKPADAFKAWKEWVREEEPDSEQAKWGATKWKQHVSGLLNLPHDGRATVDGKRVRGWVGYRLEAESIDDDASEPERATPDAPSSAGQKDKNFVPNAVFPKSGGDISRGNTERTEISVRSVPTEGEEPEQAERKPVATLPETPRGLPPTVDFRTGKPSTADAAWRRLYRKAGAE
jgi:P4 family phage/plasmid primase-like protien